MIGAFERLHGGYVQSRRLRRLSAHLAQMIPDGASVLDVGCGDGALTHALAERRDDLALRGTDVLVRDHRLIPIIPFDGTTIPFADGSFDVVMLIDVLHHTDEPMVLLREARRVARRAVVIKDHLLQGWLSTTTLRFMDRLGNLRYGVTLPYHYWPPEKWRRSFAELRLSGVWQCSLKLYPWPFRWIFERSLHFLVYLEPVSEADSKGCDSACDPAREDCDPDWEEAYLRFETPAQEIRKFRRRLLALGCADWPGDAEIADLFCGRGSNLHALNQLGFKRVQGVDLSSSLARQYQGPAAIHIADCRRLPFADGSKDIVVIHGGLHHLQDLDSDLRQTLAEIHRVLRDHGRLLIVEPWLTPFLRLVHRLCRSRLLCALWPRLDALTVMIGLEARTYFGWLCAPQMVMAEIERFFEFEHRSLSWGKLRLCGRRRPAGDDASTP